MSATTSTVTATYTVTGMTCGHCVSSVTDEVTKVPGVRSVDVDLATGQVTVGADGPLDDTAVAAAVEEAGYTVTSAPKERSGSCCGTCH
ncbi:heavy-metal-associated domain-containing protein [Streptomyces fildesensis]|uniref:heavy-metal-associated domain-containing protein n=1 Tax=Streptomyces fildesensis TaxID=375757 RepID=UPI0018E00E25|nr:cation transporter [Streptomyces fildesensis]